jgi:hypothetical protein
MKGMNMRASWRTVQLFISSQGAGVFEVEVDTDSKDVRCNCPVFTKNAFCKHTSFVENKMKYNNGNYYNKKNYICNNCIYTVYVIHTSIIIKINFF